MSRFFVTVSESESESSSSEEEMLQRPAGTAFQFSDEEEETKRIVRSSKEKRYEELSNIIKTVRNHMKVKDMSKLHSSYEDLCKAFTKAKPTIDKEDGGVVPVFYTKCLVEMDDFVLERWEDRKNLSKNNSRFLGPLRQKLRKYCRDFEKEMLAYRENPDMQDEGEEEEKAESESDVDDAMDDYVVDSFKKPVVAAETKKKFVKTDDESDDDSYWGSDSDDDTTSSEDDVDPNNMAAKFLKKSTGKEGDKLGEKKKKDKKEKRETRRRDDDEDEDDGQGEWQDVKDGVRLSQKPKMFAKDAEINHSVVIKKLTEILAARGKKGTDRSEQIDLLQELYNVAELNNLGPGISVKIMFAIIAAIFDYNPNIATCMRPEMWNKCLNNITNLLTKLTENKDISIGELITEDAESLAESPYKIRGCMLSVAERMDEEFTKMLQGCDAHSPEYVDRLKDEKTVCIIIEKLQAYYENDGSSGDRCRIYLRAIEHAYYKFDTSIFKSKEEVTKKVDAKAEKKDETKKEEAKSEKKDEAKVEKKVDSKPAENSIAMMGRLCKFIYAKDTTDRIRTRAMLCHIYHHALHDNWFEARDLMLMSHLQDSIHHSDVPTQILYNRTMVQLGICAFRHGNIKDAHNCLLDIQSGGRAKELLAQGLLLQRQHERSSEQEKIEKRRQMPFHMHINLELLECVYLVSAMLMEIPYIAAHEFDTRRRIISKSFNHQLKISDRQPLVGPPESMREHVVAAAKAMRNGNWEACSKYIINEKMNAKVWDLFHQAEKVREMLTNKIQEETLRTYLFTYSSVYNSISMVTLSEMFKLDKPTVHSIISKMIINEEIMVSLDEPSQTVVMHRTEPTRLQSLALQLSDKLGNLVDNNERIFDMKQGSFFNRGGDFQNRQNNRGDYHNRSGNRGDYQNRQGNRGGQNYQRQGGYGRNQGGGGGGGGGGYQRGGDWGDRRQNQRNNY